MYRYARMKFLTLLSGVLLMVVTFVPQYALAVTAPRNFKEFTLLLTDLISLIVPLIFALTFITIMWGVIKAWVMGEGDADQIDQGKRIVAVGVIVLAVMVSIWGIISLLQASLFGI